MKGAAVKMNWNDYGRKKLHCCWNCSPHLPKTLSGTNEYHRNRLLLKTNNILSMYLHNMICIVGLFDQSLIEVHFFTYDVELAFYLDYL